MEQFSQGCIRVPDKSSSQDLNSSLWDRKGTVFWFGNQSYHSPFSQITCCTSKGVSPSHRCLSLEITWLLEVEPLPSTIKVVKLVYLPDFHLFIRLSPLFYFWESQVPEVWLGCIVFLMYLVSPRVCCYIREVQNDFCRSFSCLWEANIEVYKLEYRQEPKGSRGSRNQEAEIDARHCLCWLHMGITQLSLSLPRLLIFLHSVYLPKDIL